MSSSRPLYKVDAAYNYREYGSLQGAGCERLAVDALSLAAAQRVLERKGLQIDLRTYRDWHLTRNDGHDPLRMKPDPANPYHFYAGEARVLLADGRSERGPDGYTSIYFRSAPGHAAHILLQRVDGLVEFLDNTPAFNAAVADERKLLDGAVQSRQMLQAPIEGQLPLVA